MQVILQLLPSVLTFSVTDIGTALLALQVAIKAAQLTIVTTFLPGLDIAFGTCDNNHVAHST